MNIFRGVILALIMFALYSCEAPHINPLDPANPNYQFSTIDGSVVTSALPHQKISGVKVTWRNENIVVKTDASGYFKIEDIPQQNGIIVFEKDGYWKDSVTVQFNSQSTKTLNDFSMNAIPALNSLLLYTIVENKYPDNQTIEVDVQAQVSDAEGDLDSVYVKCSTFGFSRQLKYNSTTKNFESSFTESELKIQSVDAAVGQNFDIVAKDKQKGLYTIGSSNIKRIIKQEVIIDSPLNKQIVGVKPVLKWKRFLPGFNFKYMIRIYTDAVTPALVWQKQNISKDDIQGVVDSNLNAGEYYWEIWCIDDYQNGTISKKASFVVQ
jgi:hypothetical protein